MNSYVLKMWGRVGQLRNVCRTNTRDKHEVAGCTDHCTGRTGLRLKFYVAWPALLGLSNSTAPCMHHKLIDSRAVPCTPRLPTLLPKARRTDDLWTSCWPAAEKKNTYHVFLQVPQRRHRSVLPFRVGSILNTLLNKLKKLLVRSPSGRPNKGSHRLTRKGRTALSLRAEPSRAG